MYAGAALAVAPRALAEWSPVAVDRRNVWRLSGVVLFGGVVGPVLLLSGLARAASASVSLWLSLEMVATACLARLIFREHLTARTWVSVALVVTASILLSTGTSNDARAALLVAGACLAWGLDNNLTALIDRFTPAQVTFVKGLVAAIVNLAAGLLLEAPVLHGPALLLGLCVGGLGYGVSLLLCVAGAQQLGATRAQLLFSSGPAWGLATAWLVVGEPVHALQLGAAVLMALAAWLWHGEQHSHRHQHLPLSHRHAHRHDDGHHDHAHDASMPSGTWHEHEHSHAALEHDHPHQPDLHHRHEHRK